MRSSSPTRWAWSSPTRCSSRTPAARWAARRRMRAMVGDRYDRDIRGALEAGLFTVWLNVRAEELPPGAAPPDATCSSIADVARILLAPIGVS